MPLLVRYKFDQQYCLLILYAKYAEYAALCAWMQSASARPVASSSNARHHACIEQGSNVVGEELKCCMVVPEMGQ